MVLFLSSCVSKKKITYFQNGSIDQAKVSNSYKTVFKPDDLLLITVSAENMEAVKVFNLPSLNFSATADAVIGNPQQQLYLVDNNGEIIFPVIGTIKIGGLTRKEAINTIKEKLDPDYVKDPIINIRITNFKVSVLGDVKNPGTFTIPNERITALEAIGLAGDLNISGRRDNVLVQREEDGKKNSYRLNLLSNDFFTSPAFYLQQNDVIYIEQNYAKSQSASYNQNTGLFISIASILIALISVITR